nr:retrovirus-related Pol polyprotein from transposon TNT 1-94 [Tanacetum cinerariifolium]
MTSLADKVILSGADNHPPMLEKDMYDSWKSRMELYMLNRQHGRMILESVENGLLLWPTVEENRVTRPKKYSELSATEAIQADCDVRVTNIILQGLPPEVYALYAAQAQSSTPLSITYPSNDFQSSIHHNVYNPSSSIPQMEYAPTGNKGSLFVTTVREKATCQSSAQSQRGKEMRRGLRIRCSWFKLKQTDKFFIRKSWNFGRSRDSRDSKHTIALMANLSHYGSDNLVEVHNQDNVTNNVIDQDVQAISTSEQSNIMNQSETKIKSGSNIILYSRINQDNKNVNEILTVELERYKDQVRILKEQNNVDKASESCAQSLEIDNFKHTISKHLKEKESLEQLVTLLKNDFQKEESRNINRELALEKQLEPKLYDGSVIQKTDAIVIRDSEETLMLEDESRSKMLQKQQDPMMNSEEPNLSTSATIVEVPKELPKVSMVNSSLKKLKFHLASFDVAVEQHCVKKKKFQDKMKYVLKENERLLEQAISTDIVNIVVNANVNYASQSQEKDTVIMKLKERIKSLSELLKIDVAPLALKLRNNRTAHNDYLKHTQEETAALREIVKNKRLLNPQNTSLDYACKYTKRVTLPTSASGSQPQGNTKKDRVQQTQTRAKKNKLEDHPRNVRPSLRNKKSVVNTKAISSVPNSKLNVNFVLKCATCNGCLFSDNHDSCVLEFINSVNARVKSKSTKKPVVQIVLWYLDSGFSKHITGDRSQLINFVQKHLGIVKFGNDHVAKIMGYGDYKIGNITISRVYFMEGLGHNLFSVGHFCDSDLEVAFRQHTCFIRNLDGVDLLTGSRGNNLYTLSLRDMMASSPICLLSKASKTKFWLWHRRLSHLNFGAINHLARQGLVRGLPKLKFEKDHLCSACAMGKSKKKSHKPKSKDSNQEKLYLLHMDLCGPMRVTSVNGKKYILVIVDDYSRFTWVKCLRSKDEAPDFIIKFLKMIQVQLKVPVLARSPQQNDVVERRNCTLIEAARTMLIYAQALLFLWAEAVATACYTQNRSITRLRHGKTPYELLHNKLLDLSFLYVFGALCYPTNDSENLRKLQPKADIRIFIGYAPTKKAFWIYNKRIRRIVETIHVDFNELTAMASEQSSSGPALNAMTPATITPEVISPIADVIPPVQAESTGSPSSTTVDQDAPLPMEPKTYTDALTQSYWIEAMQEELNEFERLELWKIIHRSDKVMVITLKLRIGRSNFRLLSDISSKESTLQLVYDVLRQTPFFKAFLVTADVSKIYMHELWATATVHHHSIRFKMDNKKHIVNLESFREMLHIYPRLPDFAYLLWKDFVYQVEHKDTKKSNDMYYPRFIKVIIHHFMSKDLSIQRRNKVNRQYVRDDQMFTTIKLVLRHQNTQQFGAMLPIELTNAKIKNSDTYKEYYTVATGATLPKTKASVRKTNSKVAMIEAQQLKLATKRSLQQTHIFQASGSGADEGTENANKDDDEEGDDDDQEEGSDDEQAPNEECKEFIHPNLSTHVEEETRDEESFNPIHKTPKNTDDEGNGEENLGMNVGREEGQDEEDEGHELYRDVNINLGRGVQMADVHTTQEFEDSHVTLTPVNLDGIKSIFETSSQMYVQPQITMATLPLSEPTLTPSTIAIFAGAVFSIPEIIQRYMDQRMNEAVKVAIQIQSDRLHDEAQAENEEFLKTIDENMQKIIKEQVKEQVKVQVSKILPKIKQTVNEQLEAEVLTQNLYKALVKAYESDKIILDTYGDTVTLKRHRDDDADKDKEPSTGSDRGSKRQRKGKELESASTPKEKATRSTGKSTQGSKSRQTSASESATAEEPMQTTYEMEELSHPEFETCANDQPIVEPSQHNEWFSQQKKPPTPYLDFLAFLMNRLKVDTLTQELLAGPTYVLMKGSCKSLVKLEFFLEEVYKATTDQLDWVNLEGQQYPHNLLKPLPLILNSRGRCVIPYDHFINNDLKYLCGGALSRKYTTSVTKTKAAYYGHIKWIEVLVPRTMWIQEPVGYDKHALWEISHWGRKRQQFYGFAVNKESAHDVYSKHRIITVTELKIVEWHNYKHLDWITVRKDNDKLYKFKEGDFKRLRIQDIEDMLLLLACGRPSTRCQKLPEEAQPHKAGYVPDGTLTDFCTALDDRLKGIRMKYLPQTI